MATEHYRKLEHMYHGANCNRYYQPRLTVGEGEAEVAIPVREELFHAAHAVHGSVYFKALDDAAFFAANSLVEDHFVVTASFHIDLLRPVTQGELRAKGRVVHAGRSRLLADAVLLDSEGREIARGGGTFVVSKIRLGPEVGYVLPG